jgi:hypothetical protein
MSIKADTKYNGTVGPGSHLYETQTGTLGYQVTIECEDGSTTFVIWLTQKNRERARRYFEALGIDPELLKDPGYLEYQLGMDIEGREVSFGTVDEEYNGKRSVKVVWIGKPSDPNLSRSAARFFGGTTGAIETHGNDLAF